MNVKACVFVLATLCASPAFATPIVSIGLSSNPVSKGDQFTVEISIADIDDLIGFQFDLEFDPSLISVATLEPGPVLTQFDPNFFFTELVFTDTSTPGAIRNIQGALFDPDTSDGGILAFVTFNADKAGTSFLTLANVQLQDLANFPDPLADFDAPPGSVTITAPTDVEPVPEPATIVLLGTGLAAAWRKHRRRIPN